MKTENEHSFYWHWLTGLPGVGTRRIGILRKAGLDARTLYELPEKMGAGQAKAYLGEALKGQRSIDNLVKFLLDPALKQTAYEAYESFKGQGISVTDIDSSDYPEILKDIFDPPYIIYYRGSLPKPEKKSAAIVGSRCCSEYGRTMAKRISAKLAARGVQIISGFARGIDTAAHNGCLSVGGATFAVLGNGIKICYPPENRFTYDEVLNNGGGILSEFAPDTPPAPGLFPLRNRIISGLADLVLVVEAGEKSGALITADHALEQGRNVMALPGRVTERQSFGCNRLIRQGAAIISSMEDVFFELGMEGDNITNKNKISEIELANPEKMLYSLLDFTPQNMDELISKSGFEPETVSAGLARLALLGLATEQGGCYLRGE